MLVCIRVVLYKQYLWGVTENDDNTIMIIINVYGQGSVPNDNNSVCVAVLFRECISQSVISFVLQLKSNSSSPPC